MSLTNHVQIDFHCCLHSTCTIHKSRGGNFYWKDSRDFYRTLISPRTKSSLSQKVLAWRHCTFKSVPECLLMSMALRYRHPRNCSTKPSPGEFHGPHEGPVPRSCSYPWYPCTMPWNPWPWCSFLT